MAVNRWSDEQKSHMKLHTGVRLRIKPKPDNYTEMCAVKKNAVDAEVVEE